MSKESKTDFAYSHIFDLSSPSIFVYSRFKYNTMYMFELMLDCEIVDQHALYFYKKHVIRPRLGVVHKLFT